MILVIRKEIFFAFRKNAIGYPLPLEDKQMLSHLYLMINEGYLRHTR
jgi:hypothetical protein